MINCISVDKYEFFSKRTSETGSSKEIRSPRVYSEFEGFTLPRLWREILTLPNGFPPPRWIPKRYIKTLVEIQKHHSQGSKRLRFSLCQLQPVEKLLSTAISSVGRSVISRMTQLFVTVSSEKIQRLAKAKLKGIHEYREKKREKHIRWMISERSFWRKLFNLPPMTRERAIHLCSSNRWHDHWCDRPLFRLIELEFVMTERLCNKFMTLAEQLNEIPISCDDLALIALSLDD